MLPPWLLCPTFKFWTTSAARGTLSTPGGHCPAFKGNARFSQLPPRPELMYNGGRNSEIARRKFRGTAGVSASAVFLSQTGRQADQGEAMPFAVTELV
jgi:hypothetical protein